MNKQLRADIETTLTERLNKPVCVTRAQEIQGGCINSTALIETNTGERFFVKSNSHALPGLFPCEAVGLEVILRTNTVRAPRAVAAGESNSSSFLILEYIESAPARPDFHEFFGRNLAELHRSHADRFGFEGDNYIGSSPQCNEWKSSWPEFFAQARFEYQIKLLEKKGRATSEFNSRLAKLIERLSELIGRHNPRPSLVHGDLWSGNFISDEAGGPVIIDPAVYYGDREVDLAMTELFGRFDPKFYAAYRESFPLEEGYELRRDIYNLYHLMNHLLIFGLSYMGGVMDILRRYT